MEQVHVITGGFYGVGDVIGRNYHEKRDQMGRPSNIWHVLPVRDNQVCYVCAGHPYNTLSHENILCHELSVWGLLLTAQRLLNPLKLHLLCMFYLFYVSVPAWLFVDVV